MRDRLVQTIYYVTWSAPWRPTQLLYEIEIQAKMWSKNKEIHIKKTDITKMYNFVTEQGMKMDGVYLDQKNSEI